jgi:hypothetical protein
MKIENELTEYQYGAMSSKYSLMAKNKLTAYAVMCLHYNRNAHIMVIYFPEECKKDNWCSIDGKISDRLDEIFGGKDSFDNYLKNNKEEIKECYNSIKQIV